ncbi:40S ribosomal protein S4 [Aureobasidium pullulans]|nr:40S ribosomal protein S4 [Aureobasidium pullulans]
MPTEFSRTKRIQLSPHLTRPFNPTNVNSKSTRWPEDPGKHPAPPDHVEFWHWIRDTRVAQTSYTFCRKHQHRLSAPSHWLLDKLSGAYAPKASPGPHKLRDCMPLIVFIRNRLKYALNGRETKAIVMQRLIKVDGKVRTDATYPAGFMDVISIEKTGENFRLVYDTKGRFTVHRITAEESEYKLGKVKRVQLGKGGIPYLVTHDARTIRYPDPAIKVNDTVKIDLTTGKISDFIRFDTGVIAMATGGRNMGRVGVITHRERHDGGFNIVHIKDAIDNEFATRESNVFVIGREKPWISLPKGKGVKLSIAEERDRRRAHAIAGN